MTAIIVSSYVGFLAGLLLGGMCKASKLADAKDEGRIEAAERLVAIRQQEVEREGGRVWARWTVSEN